MGMHRNSLLAAWVALVALAAPSYGVNAQSLNDYSCGDHPRRSIFHDEPPSATFQKFSALLQVYSDGETLRTNAVLEIEIIAGPQPTMKFGRVLRVISDVLPRSLVGKKMQMNTGGCSTIPEIGAKGTVWGTIHGEKFRPSLHLALLIEGTMHRRCNQLRSLHNRCCLGGAQLVDVGWTCLRLSSL